MLSLIKKECLTYKSLCDELIPRCDESQPTLLHCRIRAEKICASLDELDHDASSAEVSVEEHIDILKAFIFVILDYTFFLENDLAEKNFATAEAKSTVYRLLEDLNKPRLIYDAHIAGQTSVIEGRTQGDDSPNDRTFDQAVGNDLAECLYWRKGALIYMYHSATEGRLASEPNKSEMAQLLKCGVDNLKKMLSVRQEFKVIDNDAFVHDDGNTLQLIQRGLFSDTHVLALMYAGEMCFWFVKWVGEERKEEGMNTGERERTRARENTHVHTRTHTYTHTRSGTYEGSDDNDNVKEKAEVAGQWGGGELEVIEVKAVIL